MKYIHILIFLLTNMFASEVGALIQSDSGRDCPEGQILDCSQICWPESYYDPNNGICENGEGTEENTDYPNFNCENWGYDGAVCNGELLGDGLGVYFCNMGEFVGGDCADCSGIPNGTNWESD